MDGNRHRHSRVAPFTCCLDVQKYTSPPRQGRPCLHSSGRPFGYVGPFLLLLSLVRDLHGLRTNTTTITINAHASAFLFWSEMWLAILDTTCSPTPSENPSDISASLKMPFLTIGSSTFIQHSLAWSPIRCIFWPESGRIRQNLAKRDQQEKTGDFETTEYTIYNTTLVIPVLSGVVLVYEVPTCRNIN